MYNKQGQGLPVNIVIMMIIGIILFGMALALFQQFSGAGQDAIDDLSAEVNTQLAGIECTNDEYICAQTVNVRSGDGITAQVFVANIGSSVGNFRIELVNGDDEGRINSEGCGSVKMNYLKNAFEVASGMSAELPIIVSADQVEERGCSFIAVFRALKDEQEVGKTSMIVRVK